MTTTKDVSYNQPLKYQLEFYSHDGSVHYGDNVIDLHGNNDYVDLGNQASLWSQSKTKWSASFWVKLDDDADCTIGVQPATWGVTNGSILFWKFANELGFAIWQGGEIDAWIDLDLTGDRNWHHCVCVYDSTLGSANLKFYLDGMLGNVTGNATTTNNPNDTLRLGSSFGDAVNGKMRDFRWWVNKALTQNEVNLIRNDNPTAPTPNYSLPMNEGKGTPVDIIAAKTTTFGGLTAWSIRDFASNDPDPPLFIHDCVLKLNTVMHQLDFEVDNSDGLAPASWFSKGNLVFIRVWKNGSPTSSNYLFAGFIDYPNENRKGFLGHKFRVTCYEVKQALYDSNVTFIKNAPLDELGNPQTLRAKNYRIWRLVKDLLSNDAYTLLGDDALQDRIPFFDKTYSGLKQNVDLIFPRPRIKGQSAGTGLDEWSEIIGFNWYFDYSNSGNPSFQLKWPQDETQQIVLKAGDTKDINNDDVLYTSYITEDFDKESSTSQEDNFANVISAVSKIQNLIMAQSKTDSSSTLMDFKAIAMPFTTQETNFTELELMMSKQGDPSSPKNRVNGAIYVNVGNKPVGKVLDFEIPLSDIEDTPTIVNVDLSQRKRFMENLGGQTNFYWVIYQRSGKSGDPNHNQTDGVRLHRDNSTTGASLIAENGDKDQHDKLVWKTHGPNYVFTLKSTINRLFVSTNQESVLEVGKKEPQSLDFGFIEDVNTAQRYNSSILYYASLLKLLIPLKVTVPNDFLFKPYMRIPGVTVNKIFPGGVDLEIQEVEYNFAENTNECAISCLGLIDEGFPTSFGCTNLV